MKIQDRQELLTKPKPLTFKADQLVSDAVAKMSELNYGSVIIVEDDGRIAVSLPSEIFSKGSSMKASRQDPLVSRRS